MVKFQLLAPNIEFGIGKIILLPDLIKRYGNKIILVTGENSFVNSNYGKKILKDLELNNINYFHLRISGEPSPKFIDEAVKKFHDQKITTIVSIGGGSAIDAGKAISAMLKKNESVINYLEGIGTKKIDGQKVPFIAVPTTSGTGSEATKNAVISQINKDNTGFKKSLRHDNLIPDLALIDPQIICECPTNITANCGLDALTQLIESYTNPNSSVLTDTLALEGLKFAQKGLLKSCKDGSDVEARSYMAYASLLSGITLANAGLGIIHGLATPIGGHFSIPHGVVCGTLLAVATETNINKAQKNNNYEMLNRYAQIGSILTSQNDVVIERDCLGLISFLEKLVRDLDIKKLGFYNIKEQDLKMLITESINKNNHLHLNKEEMKQFLLKRV